MPAKNYSALAARRCHSERSNTVLISAGQGRELSTDERACTFSAAAAEPWTNPEETATANRTDSPTLQGAVDMTDPSTNHVCAVIVTFNPDGDLLARVSRIAPQVAQVLIVDNGSAESRTSQFQRIAEQLNVAFIRNSGNEGIARALNQGAQWAKA